MITPRGIWLASTDGKTPPRQLTFTDKKDRHPRRSPDSKSILFESTRSGEGQLWVIHIHGGEARQLTTISTEASGGIWSPDGKKIAFVSAVYPENSSKPFKEADAANKKRMEEIGAEPIGNSAEQMAQQIREETEKFAKIVKDNKVVLE